MKVTDYLKISVLKIFRNKQNIYFVILFVLCTVLILFSLTFRENFYNYINDTITKNIGFRTLSVSVNPELEDNGKSVISNIKHITSVYSSQYSEAYVESSFKNDKYDGQLVLSYANSDILPNNIIGSSFSEDEDGVAICPINFYPDSKAYDLFIDEDLILDGHDLLNTTFTITYYSYKYNSSGIEKDKEYTKNFKIIGLYNSEEIMVPSNTCYISASDITKIENIESSVNSSSTYGFFAVVDSKDNVETVISKLKSLGYDAYVRNEMDTSIISTVELASNIVISVILFTTIILTISYIKKKVINDTKNIGQLRANGYTKTNINILYANITFITSVMSYIIGITIFQIVYFILTKTALKSLIYSGISIKLFLIDYVYSFIFITVITSIIGIIYIIRKLNINIVNLIRSEE